MTSSSRCLVIILHAYGHSPESMTEVRDFIQSTLPGASVIVPRLPFQTFSFADLNEISRNVIREIDSAMAQAETEGRPYEDIIFVGYSAGSLLARKILILAHGQTDRAPFEGVVTEEDTLPRPWVSRIRRVVLLAGMNRGWRLSHHMKKFTLLKLGVGTLIGKILQLVVRKPLMIFQTRRGSPFMTNLRLQWLAMEQASPGGRSPFPIIQLLGSIDDIVSPDDNLDLVTGRNFIYMDVPSSGHESIIRLNAPKRGAARREILREALTQSEETLRRDHVLPSDEPLKYQASSTKGERVDDVIFVIHGIRDVGYWTHKIARKIQREGRPLPKIYSTETSTYGYFAMMPFILPSKRREKMEWLMDQYVEAMALYPDARFSFVGHSNGTHLLAKALSVYKACRFDRIVLADSVIRQDFDWLSLQRNGQVKQVLNYVASRDYVVALFPGCFEKCTSELGSAGHNGFQQFQKGQSNHSGFHEIWGIRGGHGAALREKNWGDIANFIVHGKIPDPATRPWILGRRHASAVLAGWLSLLVVAGIAVSIVLIGYELWEWSAQAGPYGQILAVGAYAWIIWKILTKV